MLISLRSTLRQVKEGQGLVVASLWIGKETWWWGTETRQCGVPAELRDQECVVTPVYPVVRLHFLGLPSLLPGTENKNN